MNTYLVYLIGCSGCGVEIHCDEVKYECSETAALGFFYFIIKGNRICSFPDIDVDQINVYKADSRFRNVIYTRDMLSCPDEMLG